MRNDMLMIDDVLSQLSISRTTLYILIKERKFPPSGKRRGIAVWFQTDVDDYIERIRIERDNSPEYQEFIANQGAVSLSNQTTSALGESVQP